jgi:hypothetical protein
MARNSKKSPTEIRLELEARLEAAKLREARVAAQDNPYMSQVQEVYDSYSKDIAALSRSMNGPQSFQNRRDGFRLRLAEIGAGERLALAQDENYRAIREHLKNELSTLAQSIADGGDVTQADIDSILSGIPTEDFSDLQDAFTIAREARKAFTSSKGGEAKAELAEEA